MTFPQQPETDPVRALQRRLAVAGFDPGPADGIIGPRTRAALLASRPAGLGHPLDLDVVCCLFPATPRRNIATHLPHVLRALAEAGIDDGPMQLMALATIRAESEGFAPVDERPSRFNTTPGGPPFDRYDRRADLGNQGPPDGARYRGRGFVQLTGRANYASIGRQLGADLLARPEGANEPVLAARILAAFLAARADAIRAALAAGDLRRARRLVNGGSHGLARFAETYETGAALIA